MKNYIKKIIEIRKSKQISVKKFAELLGVTTKTIYNWENEVSTPKKTDLLAIAHILDININMISDYRETGFHYVKPGLQKDTSLHRGSLLLKEIINESDCREYSSLLPLLNAEDEIKSLKNQNYRLKEKVSYLGGALDNLPFPVYIKNSKRIFTYVNQAFIYSLKTNLQENDIIGHKLTDILQQKECNPILQLEHKAFAGESVNNITIKFPLFNNSNVLKVTLTTHSTKKDKVEEIIGTINP